MKSITMYQADDGSVWSTVEDAERRDAEVREMEALYDLVGMKPEPNSIEFANGGGYVQQPTGARDALLQWLREKGAHRDSDGPVGLVMYRMHKMDDHDREWGQPYFALNPHEGKQTEVSA